MNKSDLIRTVADGADLRHAEAVRIVDTVFDAITDALRNGDSVTLSGFGTFTAKERKARQGRNPATGAPILIGARTSVTFKAAAALKDLK